MDFRLHLAYQPVVAVALMLAVALDVEIKSPRFEVALLVANNRLLA